MMITAGKEDDYHCGETIPVILFIGLFLHGIWFRVRTLQQRYSQASVQAMGKAFMRFTMQICIERCYPESVSVDGDLS